MKLWELIVELEKLEQQGKRDYQVWADYICLYSEDIAVDDNSGIIRLA